MILFDKLIFLPIAASDPIQTQIFPWFLGDPSEKTEMSSLITFLFAISCYCWIFPKTVDIALTPSSNEFFIGVVSLLEPAELIFPSLTCQCTSHHQFLLLVGFAHM